jgi:hypothetical protein
LGAWLVAAVGEFDGRAGVDIVLGGKPGAPLALLVARSERGPADWTIAARRASGWVMSIEPVDVDCDGRLDVLGSEREAGRQSVFWLDLDERSRWRQRARFDVGGEAYFLDLRGFGCGSRGDLAVAVGDGSIVRLEMESGKLVGRSRLALPDGLGRPKAARFADLDDDGTIDLALSFEAATNPKIGVAWMRSTPDGWRLRDVSGPRGTKFDRIEPLDVDGDGDLDLVTTEETRLGLVWYENPRYNDE